jgi:hypothetical protein
MSVQLTFSKVWTLPDIYCLNKHNLISGLDRTESDSGRVSQAICRSFYRQHMMSNDCMNGEGEERSFSADYHQPSLRRPAEPEMVSGAEDGWHQSPGENKKTKQICSRNAAGISQQILVDFLGWKTKDKRLPVVLCPTLPGPSFLSPACQTRPMPI